MAQYYVGIEWQLPSTLSAPAGSTSPGAGYYEQGTVINYTITPASGYQQYGPAVDNNEHYTVPANDSTHVICVTPMPYITTSAGANGSITASSYVYLGNNFSVYFYPNSGYHVASVTVDGSSVGTSNPYTFINVQTSHTISCTFALDTYVLTMAITGSGTVNPSAGDHTYNKDTVVSISATPSPGWKFKSWSDSGAQTHDVTVSSNMTRTATFEKLKGGLFFCLG